MPFLARVSIARLERIISSVATQHIHRRRVTESLSQIALHLGGRVEVQLLEGIHRDHDTARSSISSDALEVVDVAIVLLLHAIVRRIRSNSFLAVRRD